MPRPLLLLLLFAVPAAALLLVGVRGARPDPASASTAAPLRLVATVPLPGVEGRIDHLALDPSGRRLAVAALGNGSVEIVDLDRAKVVHSIRDLEEPQGVAFLPDGRLAVTCGGDGTLRLYEKGSWRPAASVDLGDDADNLRCEKESGRLWAGYGSGGLAAVEDGAVVARIPLSAHPESFQLESKGDRIFVNVPGANHVAVLDRRKESMRATWPVPGARRAFPMALDEARGRLYVGCRQPARLVVLDTTTGAKVGEVEISGDVDDIFVDADRHLLYLTCGEGFLDVVRPADARGGAPLGRTARIETAPGARTCLFVPATGRLYLAVPHRGRQEPGIHVYERTGG